MQQYIYIHTHVDRIYIYIHIHIHRCHTYIIQMYIGICTSRKDIRLVTGIQSRKPSSESSSWFMAGRPAQAFDRLCLDL